MNFRSILRYSLLYVGYLIHRNRDSKVLFYHDVGKNYTEMGTSLETIEKHIKQIRDCGFELVKGIDSKINQVMICFDDGWKGLYDERDFFLRENIVPTVFIAVDLIGSEGHLSVDEIKELVDLGFLFQTHSWSHEDLTSFDSVGLKRELVESKRKLEQLFSMQFDAICFPKGRFSSLVVKESRSAGYKSLYSSISGAYYDSIYGDVICRNLVQSLSATELKFLLCGRSRFFTKRNFKQHFAQ